MLSSKMQPRQLLRAGAILALALLATCSEPVQQQQQLKEDLTCAPGGTCSGRRLQQTLLFPPANWTTLKYNMQRWNTFNLSTDVLPRCQHLLQQPLAQHRGHHNSHAWAGTVANLCSRVSVEQLLLCTWLRTMCGG